MYVEVNNSDSTSSNRQCIKETKSSVAAILILTFSVIKFGLLGREGLFSDFRVGCLQIFLRFQFLTM